MILLAALVAAQSAPAVVNPDEVVVTAKRLERLKRLKLTTKYDQKTGISRCIFKRRSGDLALDTTVCDAALTCAVKVQTSEEARTCLVPTLDALVASGALWRAKADKKDR